MTDSECCGSEVFSMEDYGFFSDGASWCTDSTLEETITESPSPSPPPCARCERSVSLSSALKKPNSHGDKKAVHFADSLGLDLVHIRPFVAFGDPNDEIFGTTPPLYLKGFHQASYVTTLPPPPPRKYSTTTPPTLAVPTYLHTHFTPVGAYAWQNSGNPNERLVAKTFRQGVCLKSVNTIGTNLTGIVAVVNYAYKKEVHIRYTLDNWRSFIDVQALYISGSIAENIDTFSFSLFLPQCLPVGAKCEFCIRYRCDGKEYWDNNDRSNYLVECRALDPGRDDEDEGFFGIRRWL
ncbi:Glycogen-binding subunit 76A [Toxocara canis]|uniref:Glycogen-binding subunit 76A n=1 Tax=Toxocara canis TaxID=6265 RepID=A0A0B2UY03_TOXCA|nr:Glycogen-binding subunit 76A [Toxocara canis]